MENKIYTTGEMIDLIMRDTNLVFESISGKYDGNTVAFHEGMGWLMWNVCDTYEPINLSDEFMKTKWKLLGTIYTLKIEYPLKNVGKSYSIV